MTDRFLPALPARRAMSIAAAVAAMFALEASLAATASPRIAIFADAASAASNKIGELKECMEDLSRQMNAIQAKADAEKRLLTDDEAAEIDTLYAEFEQTVDDIDRREALAAAQSLLRKPTGRKTDPDDVADDADGATGADSASLPTRARASSRRRPFAQPRDPADVGRCGWNSLGEFALGVRQANPAGGGGNVDPRLIANAPTTYSTEGTGADGGFAVPPDFRTAIMEKVLGEDSLLTRTDRQTSSSNSMTFPKDETTPWQSSGGVQASWEGEAEQSGQSKVALEEETIRLNKLKALIGITEELMEDAPSLSNYLMRKVPTKFDFKINDAIVNGTGVKQPKGVLTSDALVSVAKESGQSADTILYANISNMWSRLYAPCRKNAVWLINQDIETQLDLLAFPGSGTAVPVYLPAGGLSASPYATLKGRPVIPTEACQTLGDAGDIILVDLTQYLTLMKTTGIKQDVSMHLWFDYDIAAFKFTMRVGGQPWWGAAITPANGVATRSFAVSLAARA